MNEINVEHINIEDLIESSDNIISNEENLSLLIEHGYSKQFSNMEYLKSKYLYVDDDKEIRHTDDHDDEDGRIVTFFPEEKEEVKYDEKKGWGFS